ncbi:hypothetical protein LCGC14_1251990 [marine sediment metagenome]|uniref:Uncharacterized protein n=1 Tax=marine sediment metagenome TaxID=412755 RepID=A0A0F9LPF4_9ZZZZ
MAKLELTGRDLIQGGRNISILKNIQTHHQHAKIQVAGKSVAIDGVTANALATVYDALKTEHQLKFAAMLHHSPATFQRILDFSWAHVK